MVITYGVIIGEIFWDILKIMPIIMAISMVPKLIFLGYLINPKDKKNVKVIKFIFGLIVIDLIILIPYSIILWIEGII